MASRVGQTGGDEAAGVRPVDVLVAGSVARWAVSRAARPGSAAPLVAALVDQITVDDLPEKIRNYRMPLGVVPGVAESEIITLDELEHRYILRVLKQLDGNKTMAAEMLGLDRRTLYRKLERFGHDAEKEPQ